LTPHRAHGGKGASWVRKTFFRVMEREERGRRGQSITMRDRLKQGRIGDGTEVAVQVLDIDVQESVLLVVSEGLGDELNGSETGLLARRHKDDRGLGTVVGGDGSVRGLAHGNHHRGKVGDVVPLNLDIQLDRANVGVKVENALARATAPGKERC